jgi:hypothetical protein
MSIEVLVGPGNSSRFSDGLPFRTSWASTASSSAESASVGLAGGLPANALVRNGSGQPPGGSPNSPRRNPITDSGMSKQDGSAANSSAPTPAPTNASARSPTTLLDGVTFTKRPSIRSAEELELVGNELFECLANVELEMSGTVAADVSDGSSWWAR